VIINLKIQKKKICVVGGGNEALKRITSLLKENCTITVISHETNKKINNLALKNKIQIKRKKLENANFLEKEKPFLVITTTNNRKLNSMIIEKARKLKILAYSSDNPDQSDFSHPAIVNLEKIIDIAIFTGSKSPAMAKKIKEKLEKSLQNSISMEDIEQIKIQQIARAMIKDKIEEQSQRKKFLTQIMNDKKIKQLIKDKQGKKIEKHIKEMLRDWK